MRTTLFILFLTTQGVLLGYFIMEKRKMNRAGQKQLKQRGERKPPLSVSREIRKSEGLQSPAPTPVKKTEYRSEVSKKYKGN